MMTNSKDLSRQPMPSPTWAPDPPLLDLPIEGLPDADPNLVPGEGIETVADRPPAEAARDQDPAGEDDRDARSKGGEER